ncbi:hypothetical protein LTR84_005184 [Exophiala bonariae]|uniref:Glutaredoxin domain-containing protein n=1 Tax=Exophiala bonariae TaxID=1690606 RepID=A0AAV9NP22_9EURO|nr:hypothetical protein LTR84_005184 [Exophiala bonariae]
MATPAAADSTLYLYTSLTAGSSHIITATSRLETILKANKIPFRAVDVATDEKARMLWGRRSKGRKLPGLVKFGSIVGDIEQIEEWNEYGELKEQIAGADEFGTLGVSTLSPNPATTTATDTAASTPQRSGPSGPPSRASSETRHISIAEPTKDKEKDAAQKSTDSPGNQILRQLGAEAAAKAAQKKTGTTSAAKVPVKATPSTSDQTPTPAATKLSADAAVESADTATEATASKTPAQLATEGAKRTSIDKIAESEDVATSPVSTSPTQAGDAGEAASTEAQVLEVRRTSSIAKTKSKLSEATPAAESDTVLSDETESKTAVEDSEISATAEPVTRKHRGSDIGEASPEEIRALEKKLSIPEEDEDDEEDDDDDDSEDDDDDDDDDEDEEPDLKKGKSTTTGGVGSTDKAEKEATKGQDPQKEDPKDDNKAGVSVGD